MSLKANDLVYLRNNVQVEPLIDNWYAWSYLIPPATAARNLTERHLKIMESYINAPQLHHNAARNPKMLGGPFIDYKENKVDEIKELRDSTKSSRANLIILAEAIAQLDAMLREHGTGESLASKYAHVPQALQGYVELVYDLDNHPSFRLIEPLLYRSEFYNRSTQSLMLSLVSGDDRPFVFSTPRLPESGAVQLELPFESSLVDQLFRLKKTPCYWGRLQDMLPVKGHDDLEPFVSTAEPSKYEPYRGRGLRWRYFGHACVLIEGASGCVLIDPVLSYTYESQVSRYTYDDLPDHIDYVLITHNHQDHMLFETVLQIRHRVSCFVVPRNGGGNLQDPSMALILRAIGCSNVVELSECESISFGNDRGSILGLPFLGEHADLDIRSKLAYLVQFEGLKLLFAADSCNIEPRLYDHIHRETGDVDVLFLGMECEGAPLSWLYGALATKKIERRWDQSRRLNGSNCAEALKLIERLNCKRVYVYAMGLEPWLKFMVSLQYTEASLPILESNKLVHHCRERGIPAERLYGEKEIFMEASS